MILIDCDQQAATVLLDKLGRHLPPDTECGRPGIIHGGAALITEDEQRFCLEVDASDGTEFVTRTRINEAGVPELTAWQDQTEIVRRTMGDDFA